MDVSKGGSWHFGFNMAGDISEELVRGREYIFALNRPRAINDARIRSVNMFNPLKGNAMSMTLDGFCHRMMRASDVNIHAVIGGDGPPLVLLHGFPQTWWAWRKMMPLLAVKRTVVAIDLPGAGHSDSPQAALTRQV